MAYPLNHICAAHFLTFPMLLLITARQLLPVLDDTLITLSKFGISFVPFEILKFSEQHFCGNRYNKQRD